MTRWTMLVLLLAACRGNDATPQAAPPAPPAPEAPSAAASDVPTAEELPIPEDYEDEAAAQIDPATYKRELEALGTEIEGAR